MLIPCLVAFPSAFALAILATRAVRTAASALGVVDRPDGYRKVHNGAVPLLGGIAIFVAFSVPLLALDLLGRRIGPTPLWDGLQTAPGEIGALLAGGAVALLLGVIDDVRGLRATYKLLLQILAASIAIGGGYAMHVVSTPFGAPLQLGIFGFPIAVFWFLGCMNGVNLADGLDGLAAGVCLFASIALFVVSLLLHNAVSMLLLACLIGAILGFLLFNFHPAKIFLGDSGSMLLGYLVAALSLRGARTAEGGVALLIPFVALGIPVLDTTLAILRRWSRKLPVSAADRQHIHHVLLSMGLSHQRVVILMYMAYAVLGGAAVLISEAPKELAVLVLVLLCVAASVCIRLVGKLRVLDLFKQFWQSIQSRRRSASVRVSVERTIHRLDGAASVDQLWELAGAAFHQMGLDFAALRFHANGGPPVSLTWKSERPEPSDHQHRSGLHSWSAHLNMRSNGRFLGELELDKRAPNGPFLTDVPELADRLRDEFEVQLMRLEAAERPELRA
ncbi:MAG: MraY family glycosyltransferase [Candidatus Brocadiaceae bacterium]|jgi:UDP-GlcNAc:undecaprenyl-phosphate GlcNAc-1-phosphate transferase